MRKLSPEVPPVQPPSKAGQNSNQSEVKKSSSAPLVKPKLASDPAKEIMKAIAAHAMSGQVKGKAPKKSKNTDAMDHAEPVLGENDQVHGIGNDYKKRGNQGDAE